MSNSIGLFFSNLSNLFAPKNVTPDLPEDMILEIMKRLPTNNARITANLLKVNKTFNAAFKKSPYYQEAQLTNMLFQSIKTQTANSHLSKKSFSSTDAIMALKFTSDYKKILNVGFWNPDDGNPIDRIPNYDEFFLKVKYKKSDFFKSKDFRITSFALGKYDLDAKYIGLMKKAIRNLNDQLGIKDRSWMYFYQDTKYPIIKYDIYTSPTYGFGYI